MASLFYFGRDTRVRELLGLLDGSRLLAVIGSPGCDKSAPVYAGVVPPPRATDGTRSADFRPRGRPSAALAQALVPLWPIEPAPQARRPIT
jgi:hypothetical protein